MRQIICPECRGEGVIEVEEGAWYVRLDDCPSCGGSGEVDDPEANRLHDRIANETSIAS
jgi:DnaJ-class molecular chaperone